MTGYYEEFFICWYCGDEVPVKGTKIRLRGDGDETCALCGQDILEVGGFLIVDGYRDDRAPEGQRIVVVESGIM